MVLVTKIPYSRIKKDFMSFSYKEALSNLFRKNGFLFLDIFKKF